jgi:predicted MPP superfamily phosphohydrolase
VQLKGDTRFRTIRATLPIPGWPAELSGWTVIHLSDVHLRTRWEPVLDPVVDLVRSSGAEAVLCSGDWVDHKHNHLPALPHLHRLLTAIRTEGGTFSVIGNHDGPHLARHAIEQGSPVTFVDHRRVTVRARSREVELIGVGGWKRKHARTRFLARFPSRKPGLPRIVLAHYPSSIRMVSLHLQPDLFLSGHTHGGQVCLPLCGPLFTHDDMPTRYSSGIHRWCDTWMSISRGIGFSHRQLRTFCPPEVAVITLVSG